DISSGLTFQRVDAFEVIKRLLKAPPGSTLYNRGDANADGGLDMSDAVFILNYLFLGSDRPACGSAADSDGSGAINLTDVIYLLNYAFLGGDRPPPPGPPGEPCGADDGAAAVECDEYPPCG
ncbi:MAG: dockerin type I domain-containing protein, partial [Planctomycetota bacterium]